MFSKLIMFHQTTKLQILLVSEFANFETIIEYFESHPADYNNLAPNFYLYLQHDKTPKYESKSNT